MPELHDLTLDLCACARSTGPRAVARALLACPGVTQAHVDAHVTWALVTFDRAGTTAGAIVEHLAASGFEVRVTALFDPDPSVPTSSRAAPPDPCPPTTPDPVQEPA